MDTRALKSPPTKSTPHPFHLVDPSPWPLVTSLIAGLMVYGGVQLMHGHGSTLFFVGLASILLCMLVWFRDIIKESIFEKAHSDVANVGFRYGMLLFIVSEIMFFFAFFWAYFNAALFPPEVIGGIWPPPTIEFMDPLDLPLMMTLILLLSGCTATWAHHAILENKQKDFSTALGLTVALGVLFLGFQVYEYGHAAFSIKDGIFGSTFYLATGFHGFHVFVGTIFLAVCWWRAKKGHFTADDHFGFEAAAWYWHFVDVVWLFLFFAIYIWGGL